MEDDGPRLKTVDGGPGLCTGDDPGEMLEGLGLTSNLAAWSWLKNVFGLDWKDGDELLPNTDWRVRGDSGPRKLLKFTNGDDEDAVGGDWPGKVTGLPLLPWLLN